IHLERFPEVPREWLDDTLAREWGRLLEVRREVTKALETARAQGLIGSGLEARLRVAAAPEDLPELLRAKRALLPTLFIVSQVELGQITKLIVLGRLEPGVPIRVIDGFLSLTLVLNPGLAFGLLASVPAEWRWVVALLSVGALVILVQVALRVLPRGRWPDHGAIR